MKIVKIFKVYIKLEIVKYKFLQHKSPASKKYIDINKIVLPNKVSFSKKGFKYFIGYKDV